MPICYRLRNPSRGFRFFTAEDPEFYSICFMRCSYRHNDFYSTIFQRFFQTISDRADKRGKPQLSSQTFSQAFYLDCSLRAWVNWLRYSSQAESPMHQQVKWLACTVGIAFSQSMHPVHTIFSANICNIFACTSSALNARRFAEPVAGSFHRRSVFSYSETLMMSCCKRSQIGKKTVLERAFLQGLRRLSLAVQQSD